MATGNEQQQLDPSTKPPLPLPQELPFELSADQTASTPVTAQPSPATPPLQLALQSHPFMPPQSPLGAVAPVNQITAPPSLPVNRNSQWPPPMYSHTQSPALPSYDQVPPSPHADSPGPSGYVPVARLPGYNPVDVIPTPPTPGYDPKVQIQWGDATITARELSDAMESPALYGPVQILARFDPLQRRAVCDSYRQRYSRDLAKDIEAKDESGAKLVALTLARGPLVSDVMAIRKALKGLGTNEMLLNEMLLGRSNADMKALVQQYAEQYPGRTLMADIKGDLSGDTRSHFETVIKGIRTEETVPVTQEDLEQDVAAIYRDMQAKKSRVTMWSKTDTSTFRDCLARRNNNHIRAMAILYQQRYAMTLEELIKKEVSGHLKDALLFQLLEATDKYMHTAELLDKALQIPVSAENLARRLMRCHWNRAEMANVKGAFETKFGRSLASKIDEKAGASSRVLQVLL